MKVRVTFEASDELRRAVLNHVGVEGLATRADLEEFFRQYGMSTVDDLIEELAEEEP